MKRWSSRNVSSTVESLNSASINNRDDRKLLFCTTWWVDGQQNKSLPVSGSCIATPETKLKDRSRLPPPKRNVPNTPILVRSSPLMRARSGKKQNTKRRAASLYDSVGRMRSPTLKYASTPKGLTTSVPRTTRRPPTRRGSHQFYFARLTGKLIRCVPPRPDTVLRRL